MFEIGFCPQQTAIVRCLYSPIFEAVYIWKFRHLLAVGGWFSPGNPVSSTNEIDISLSSFHRLDMTLVVAEGCC